MARRSVYFFPGKSAFPNYRPDIQAGNAGFDAADHKKLKRVLILFYVHENC